MDNIDIYRSSGLIASVKPTNTSGLTRKIMGEDIVTLVFELSIIVDFIIGDYANIFGDVYKINRFPLVVKKNQYRYEYSIEMQGSQYDLNNAQFMFYDRNNDLKEGDFSLTGTASTFIDLLITNINRVSAGWVKGGVISSSYKTMTFSKEDCLTVLARIAKEFETEYYVLGTTVHLAKKINLTSLQFYYGFNKGLYSIQRKQQDNQRIVTRLYAFGAEKNLPPGYPSSRLRLPGGYDDLIHNVTWTLNAVTSTTTSYTFSWNLPLNGVTNIGIRYRRLGATTWNEFIVPNGATGTVVMQGTGTFEVQLVTYLSTTIYSYTGVPIAADMPTATMLLQSTITSLLSAGMQVVINGTPIDGTYNILNVFNFSPTGRIDLSPAPLAANYIGNGSLTFYDAPPVAIATTPIILVGNTNIVPVFVQPLALPYLEENILSYGIIEGDYIDDSIFPERTGTVTGVDATNPYVFSDSTMDFDINLQLLPGLPPKVTFNTGQLSGYSFEISAYNVTTGQFTILKNKDEKTLDIPTFIFRMGIGDKYVITEIEMPFKYVTNAEARLQDKAQLYLDQNSSPIYQYIITCDPKFFKSRLIKMNVGDVVFLTDPELKIDKAIRVVGITKSLIEEYEYTLELGDVVTPSTVAQIISASNSNTSNINGLQRVIEQNKLLSGTFVGTLIIEQGSIKIVNIKQGTGKPLVIDTDGTIYHT